MKTFFFLIKSVKLKHQFQSIAALKPKGQNSQTLFMLRNLFWGKEKQKRAQSKMEIDSNTEKGSSALQTTKYLLLSILCTR